MKKLLFFSLLIIISLVFILSSCGDPYKGDYREATGQEKLNAISTIKGLKGVGSTDRSNIEIEGKSNSLLKRDGKEYTAAATNYELYDYSDSSRTLIYSKITNKVMEGKSEIYSSIMEFWFIPSEETLYLSYVVNGNNVAIGYTKNISNELFDNLFLLGKDFSPITLSESLSNKGTSLFVSGDDKFRIDYSDGEETNSSTYISILSGKDFVAKKSSFINQGSDYTTNVYEEMFETSDKVKLPNLAVFGKEYSSSDVLAITQNAYSPEE